MAVPDGRYKGKANATTDRYGSFRPHWFDCSMFSIRALEVATPAIPRNAGSECLPVDITVLTCG